MVKQAVVGQIKTPNRLPCSKNQVLFNLLSSDPATVCHVSKILIIYQFELY